VNVPWYLSAIGAALLWGIHYPLIDHALKRLSLFSVLLLTALPVVALTPFFLPRLRADCRLLLDMGWPERMPVLGITLTSLLASVLLFLSIDSKNATLASLIEISYPVFVALFAFLLFREVHLNGSVLLGGAMVMAGVAIIVLHNP
jgi:drug/metabolite transporter (DMT)-like permease